MHKVPQHFVGRYNTLTGSHEHRMAPGNDGLVNVDHLKELVKGREGAKKKQNLANLPILGSK